MSRQLNVRSDEAFAIAHKVADITGKPVSEVVLDALREHGGRFRDESGLSPTQQANIEAIRAIGRRAAVRMRTGVSVEEIMRDMYDENGLPK